MALGVLTQPQVPQQQPIAYLSRELHIISHRWLHCLTVIGRTALLTPEALELTNYVTQLSAFQQALIELQELTPDPAPASSKHLFEPRTEVLIKTLGSGGQSLEPFWEGSYQVIISFPTAVKVPRIDSWVHHTQVKRWHPDQN